MNKNFIIDLDVKGLEELGNLKLPDPTLLDYYKRLSQREIFWNREVDEELVEFSHQIIQWNKDDKGIPIENRIPIKIFINTVGGCLNSIMNFANVVKLSKTPVYTIGMGKIYSAGFLMLIAGTKRFCFKNSEGLLHSGSFGIINSTEKVMDYIEHTKKVEKSLKEYVVDNTKITQKEYEKRYRDEWFMLATDMLKHGVVDCVIEDLEEVF